MSDELIFFASEVGNIEVGLAVSDGQVVGLFRVERKPTDDCDVCGWNSLNYDLICGNCATAHPLDVSDAELAAIVEALKEEHNVTLWIWEPGQGPQRKLVMKEPKLPTFHS